MDQLSFNGIQPKAALLVLLLVWGCQESAKSRSEPAITRGKIILSPIKEVASHEAGYRARPLPLPDGRRTGNPVSGDWEAADPPSRIIDPFALTWRGPQPLENPPPEKLPAVQPHGRRLSPLEKKELDRWVLTAIIRTPAEKIALVEEDTGKGYPVRLGTRIGVGGGIVVAIDSDGIVVEEPYQAVSGKITKKRRALKFSQTIRE